MWHVWETREEHKYTVLLGRPEGKRTLRRHMRRWEDNIKLDGQEAGLGGMDWIDLAEDKNT